MFTVEQSRVYGVCHGQCKALPSKLTIDAVIAEGGILVLGHESLCCMLISDIVSGEKIIL